MLVAIIGPIQGGTTIGINELQKQFADETLSRLFFESMICSSGRVCPHCGSAKSLTIKGQSSRAGFYECGKADTPRPSSPCSPQPPSRRRADHSIQVSVSGTHEDEIELYTGVALPKRIKERSMPRFGFHSASPAH